MTMKTKVNWVFASLLLGVWLCGCASQGQSDVAPTQDMVPRDSKSCKDIRENLEQMVYTTYKGSIPRQMLKNMLPGLVEPLLPATCLQSDGHTKWLLQNTQTDRLKRQVGGFFMPPLTPMKDPGDHPPPGMLRNPMKDPGDRPAGMYGVGHLGGSGLGSIMSTMMTMARSAGYNSQQPWSGSFVPLSKPFRGNFYGDQLPTGRRKRSVAEEEDAAHHRQKRANGEEEKKGGGFDLFGFNGFFFDRPDKKSSSAAPSFPFFPSIFSPFSQPFSQPRRQRSGFFFNNAFQPLRNAFGPRPGMMYGDAPSYRRPITRQAPILQQAPVLMPPMMPVLTPPTPVQNRAAPAPLTPPVAAAPSLMGSPAAMPPASHPNAVQPSPMAQPAVPATPFVSPPMQPAGGQLPMAAGAQPSQPVMPMTPVASQPVVQPSAFVPASPQPSSQPAGTVFGDTLPAFGSTATAGTARRVKRASDNSDSSSSSNTDVVTIGDFTMPADTFDKLISPRKSPSDDRPPSPPYRPAMPYRPMRPAPPPPPMYYPPPPPLSPTYYTPQQPFMGVQPPPGFFPPTRFPPQRGFPVNRRTSFLTSRRAAVARTRHNNMLRARQSNYVYGPAAAAPVPRMAPLPMGAAQPLVYGTQPTY